MPAERDWINDNLTINDRVLIVLYMADHGFPDWVKTKGQTRFIAELLGLEEEDVAAAIEELAEKGFID